MEAQDLIYLASCAVNGAKPEAERVAGMDLDALYELANRHMLAATVAPALEAAGVRDERFVKASRSSILKNVMMDAEMEAVFAKMDAAGIWHMPLKGILLQHMYPAYGMRQMSDHDILFDASRADDVRRIMEEQGFTAEDFGISNHDVYYKEPVCNFEMHRALFDGRYDEALHEYYRDVEKRLLGDGWEKRFSPEDCYVYLTAHEYRHYYIGGTGLRSLLDTYVYLKKQPVDMRRVAPELEKLGIADFEAANRSLALRLFSGGELTADDRRALDYMLVSGVYGTMDHRVENAMSKKGWGKLRYALDRFSVPFSRKNRDYEEYERVYPLFYRHRLLLPLLPFYRVMRGLKNGRMSREVRALRDARRKAR